MSEWNGLPLVIFGCGGISREISYLVNEINRYNRLNVFDFKGFVSEKQEDVGKSIYTIPVVACDKNFKEFSSSFPVLGAVIPHGNPALKKKIAEKITKLDNIAFPNLIHPSAGFNKQCVTFGRGNILTAGVQFTTNIIIGNFNLFNLNTTIGHETVIKDYCVINPLSAISGGVTINESVVVGTGAKILQYLEIKSHSIIGAGAVVTKNVEKGSTVVGVPAKAIKKIPK